MVATVALLTGCASVQEIIPSFWDDNQSARITDFRLRAEQFRCDQPHLPQIQALRSDLRWFDLYSESKGPRQADVRRALRPLSETLEEFRVRTETQGEGSQTYCRLKVQNLQLQSQRAAQAILRRF